MTNFPGKFGSGGPFISWTNFPVTVRLQACQVGQILEVEKQEVELVLCVKYYVANIPNSFSDSSSS